MKIKNYNLNVGRATRLDMAPELLKPFFVIFGCTKSKYMCSFVYFHNRGMWVYLWANFLITLVFTTLSLALSLLLRLQSTIGNSRTRPSWGTSYWQSGIIFFCSVSSVPSKLAYPHIYVYAQGGRGPPQGGQSHTWGSQLEQAKPLWSRRIGWLWKGIHLLSKLQEDQCKLSLLWKLINMVRKRVNGSEDEKSIDN